jgi:cytosine/adenosine deaminase-related metal-dependent hydrolase
MDPNLGDVSGNVVVEDGTIVAVGEGATGSGERIDGSAMVVIPGLVDTHRHTWQAALRFRSVGWTLLEYVQNLQQALAPQFAPEDVYAANLLGALTALDAGITTLRDDSHVQNTPEHGEAAVQALRDSGIRASFGHGWPSSAEYMTDSSLPHPDSMERIREEVLRDDSDASLVTMHAHLRGPSLSTLEMSEQDLARARALGLRSSIHIGAALFPGSGEVDAFAERGLLGPDLTFVHCCTTSDEELRTMAEAGCSASATALIEAIMPGLGWPATARLAAAGVTTSFGVDVEVAAAGDLFNVMRAALMADRLAQDPE